MQSRDHIVVLLPYLVILQRTMLHSVLNHLDGNMYHLVPRCLAIALYGQFKDIQRGASIAAGKDCDLLHGILVDADIVFSQAVLFIL